jgi:hypothetical protein
MHDYVGQCVCGRIELHLDSELTPGQFQPRSDAPTCRFCTAHDGVWISDPKGTLRLRAAAQTTIKRFASGQVQFHFCAACDTLVYALFEGAAAGTSVAVVRVGLFPSSIRGAAQPTVITNFENETVALGRQRRLENWTPVQRS